MEAEQKLSFQLEILFWLFTAILVIAIIYPIHKTGVEFPFYTMLAMFIVVFVTLARYIFLLKFTFLAYNKWVKAALIAVSIPFIFFLIGQLNFFQAFVDEDGLDQYFRFMPLVERLDLQKYIRSVMIFFAAGSIIAAIIFPFRLIMSIWRNFNRDSV